MHRTLSLLLAASFAAPLAAATPAASDTRPVDVTYRLDIPLRDGVALAATRYRGRGEGPQPCVFTLTPYTRQAYHERGMYFGARGYVFLTVDARGRGDSEGAFEPLLQEADDAKDVVDWLAAQPFCKGKVSMWGGSYAGHNQWAAASRAPKALGSIVPVASPYAGVDFPMARNIFYAYDLQWLTLTAGRTSQNAIFGDQAYWSALSRRLYADQRPFRELDALGGMPSPVFQRWIAHPHPDAHWDAYNPTAAQYAAMTLPILSITGHYDGDQPGAFAHYRAHLANAPAAAQAKHFLIVGPWDHAGTRTPRAEVGGLKFGPASMVDLNALHREWYDWTLKDGARPAFLKDRVAWYVVEADVWRYASRLEDVTARTLALSLASEGPADSVFGGGRLIEGAARGGPDRYTYDPGNLTLLDIDPDLERGLVDQRAVLAAPRGSQLVYHGEPLAEDTEIAGFFELDAYIEVDVPDTDVQAQVYEIKPDGSSVFLSGDRIRGRYRRDPRAPTALQPGAVERWRFDQFSFQARRLAKGSRLRLVIGPVNGLGDQRNFNTGGDVSAETAKNARVAKVTLHHDAQHPSVLRVPIGATK